MSSFYRQELENYLKTLSVHAKRVLDIGGSAFPVRGRVKEFDVEKYEILDNCSEKGFENKGDWKDPDHIYDFNMEISDIGKFDVIFCLEVFEYVYDPITALENIKKCLSKDGKAIITFPFVYPVHQPVDLDSIRYTENGIMRIMRRVGLKIDKITARNTPHGQLLMDFYMADKMHPAKHYPHHSVLGWIVEVSIDKEYYGAEK